MESTKRKTKSTSVTIPIGWKDVIEEGKFFMGRTASATDLYGSSKRAPARHRKRASMLFGDGHVQYWHFPANYESDGKYQSGWFDMNAAWW